MSTEPFEQLVSIKPFVLGQGDISERFTLAKSKLYGRDEDIQTLLKTFDRVSASGKMIRNYFLILGKSELLLVSGYSGVGKSSLINEIQKPISLQRSYFTSGKYDQLGSGLAYSALTAAFQSLIKQILGESKERTEMWKKKILLALGNYGSVIMDIIPDLRYLIGIQPPVQELGLQEAKIRFDLLFQQFIRAFVEEDRVLVLFLDDVQVYDFYYYINYITSGQIRRVSPY
jgi:predicted ATPase